MRLIAGTTPKSSSDSARRLPKRLRKYLAETGADQYQVDPPGAGARRSSRRPTSSSPSRAASALACPGSLLAATATLTGARSGRTLTESPKRSTVESETGTSRPTTSRSSSTKATRSAWWPTRFPDPATLFVSNSMPVRDLDRFVGPTTTSVTALGNRGVSGIDGIVSSALGAGSATTDDLTLVVGDLALYHDTNGLLALDRCDVDATVVLINNDGGGIFHELPIESFEPEFTESFKTPHGIEFEPMADLHGLAYTRIDARPDSVESAGNVADDLADAYTGARDADGSHLIEVRTDAESSHRTRKRLEAAVDRAVHGDEAE